MFVFKTLVTALAFSVASVYSAPHGLRGRCKHTGKTLSSFASAVAANTEIASSSIASIATPSSAPVTSSVAAASTSAAASSASASSASSSSSTRPSSSSSAAAPANTLLSASTLIRALLPVSQKQFWTTAQGASKVLPMQDSTFRPNSMLKDIAPVYVEHAGKSAMLAHFPQGSFIPSHTPRGGLSFYGPGPSNVDLTTAKEVTFGYSVFFPDGFDFVKGGKMPGIYGGDSEEGSKSCSGGSRNDACFSARFMWRTGGAGEMYTYLPPSFKANDNVCNIAPESHCNPTYGASVGRNSFQWKTGDWNTISQRVRLNDAGQQNGELEVFVEGKSVINVGGLVLRDGDAGRIRGMMMQTFFGGADSSWATPKDQDVHFADFSIAITESL